MAFCLVAVGGLALLMFQNFKSIPIEKLRPRFNVAQARVVNPYDGSADLRDFAPVRPQELEERESFLSAPQSGHDLESIGGEWLRKQAHYLTGGADEKIVRQLNRSLNRLINSDSDDEFNKSGSETDGTKNAFARKSGTNKHDDSKDEPLRLLPKSMKFTSINRLEMDFGSQTHLTCSFEGSSVRWDIVRPINEKMDMNFRHETAGAKSSFLLNYNW